MFFEIYFSVLKQRGNVKKTIEERHKTELAEVERKLRKVQSDLEISEANASLLLLQLINKYIEVAKTCFSYVL